MGLPLLSLFTILITALECFNARAIHHAAIKPRCSSPTTRAPSTLPSGECFPRQIPNVNSSTPTQSPSDWWCPLESENGFLGFTYGVDACQDRDTLARDFSRMRSDFGVRYVRQYGSCDDDDFLDRFVSTAYSSGLGVYATIWFGFDGDDKWKGRRDRIIDFIKSNDYAPYTIRSVDVGSEPLTDGVLDPKALTDEINNVKSVLNPYNIKVSISEMQWPYSQIDNPEELLGAEEIIHAHQLPYYGGFVKHGSDAHDSVFYSTQWLADHTGNSKKIIFTQAGWPTIDTSSDSSHGEGSLESAQAYAQLLDSSCEALKEITPQGVGWFWHIWEDSMMDGWGVLDSNGDPKWDFRPRTSC